VALSHLPLAVLLSSGCESLSLTSESVHLRRLPRSPLAHTHTGAFLHYLYCLLRFLANDDVSPSSTGCCAFIPGFHYCTARAVGVSHHQLFHFHYRAQGRYFGRPLPPSLNFANELPSGLRISNFVFLILQQKLISPITTAGTSTSCCIACKSIRRHPPRHQRTPAVSRIVVPICL
jgi:hypothetical protein